MARGDVYESLKAYAAAQPEHPGFPSDQCYVGAASEARLEVMDNGDVLLETLGTGAVEVLAHVAEPRRYPNVLDALLDPVFAQRELDGRNSTVIERAELDEALADLPESAVAQSDLIAAHERRQAAAEAVLRDGRRRSYALVAAGELPEVPADALFRREQVDYDAVDWRLVAAAASGYLAQGGDPLDFDAVDDHARAQGLDGEAARWTTSLFADPIKLGKGEERFGNGRHRAMAARAQGVVTLPVFTAQAMAAAERRAAQLRAGAPELRPLDEPATPAAIEPARAGLEL